MAITYVFLLSSLGLVITQGKNCGSLEDVTNGQIDYPDGTEFGGKAVVTCNPGYIAVGGTSNIICEDRGWSGRPPVCEVVTCAPPPAIENGTYYEIKDMYSYREVVMYSCQAGYTLNGSRSRTCSEDGSFKPDAPTCYGVVECEEPHVANGVLSEGAQPPYTENSTVTLQCNTGYVMKGSSTQMCDKNGSWSPGLPVCEMPVPCEEPRIANGGWMSGARPPYTEKSTVTLQCNTGYIMRGTSTQTCENGSWAPGLPICERECEEPRVDNGVLSGGAQPPYTEKSTVTLQCNIGYVMKGSSTQICDKNGRWSPGLPKCERVCEEPRVDNGVMSGGAQPPYTEKSTVTLQCNTGYVMKGSSTQICDKNGRWSPGLPVCERVEGPPDQHNCGVGCGIGRRSEGLIT